MPPHDTMHFSEPPPARAHIDRDASLLRDPRFLRFSAANLLRLIGLNALIYGLFILIVGDENAGIATAAFVLTSTVPSILFGFLGGVMADAFPRKATMLVSLVVQAAVVAYLLRYDPSIPMIVGLTFVIWTADQFYSPAESAALGAVAYPERAARASALTNAVSLFAQVVGAGLVAPLTLKVWDARGLFGVSLALFLLAAYFFARTPRLTAPDAGNGQRIPRWRSLTEGWRTIREHDELSRAISFFVLLDCAFVVAIVAAPSFITDVLGTSAENAVYIFAPGAIGIVLGLVFTPLLLRALPAKLLVTIGFALFVGVMLTLPFVVEVAAQLDQRFVVLREAQRFLHVPREIAATALLLPFAGFGVTMVRVAAKTAILRHAPHEKMAQVFATETTLDSIATLIPTVAAGAALSIIDVRAVLIVTGSLTAVAAVLTLAGPLRLAPTSAGHDELAHNHSGAA
jgi:MFS family permease